MTPQRRRLSLGLCVLLLIRFSGGIRSVLLNTLQRLIPRNLLGELGSEGALGHAFTTGLGAALDVAFVMMAAHLDLELESIAFASVLMPRLLLETARLVVESISNAAFAVDLDVPDDNLLFLAADDLSKDRANRPTVRVPQIVWLPLAV